MAFWLVMSGGETLSPWLTDATFARSLQEADIDFTRIGMRLGYTQAIWTAK